jgi:hypothetical protein
MKRGFLFGAGSSLILGVLSGLAEMLWGRGCTFRVDDECQAVAAVITTAISAPLSVVALWKAYAAAPNRSWPHAIGGWLIGFCVPSIVWIILLMTAFITLTAFRP